MALAQVPVSRQEGLSPGQYSPGNTFAYLLFFPLEGLDQFHTIYQAPGVIHLIAVGVRDWNSLLCIGIPNTGGCRRFSQRFCHNPLLLISLLTQIQAVNR